MNQQPAKKQPIESCGQSSPKKPNLPAEISMGLSSLRQSISDVDQEILDLFARRMALARQIAGHKAKTGSPVFDPQREDEVAALALAHTDPVDAIRAATLLRSLMRLSREAQYDLLVNGGHSFALGSEIAKAPQKLPKLKQIVYQGSAGSYAAQASQRLFPNVPMRPSATWREACDLVKNGEVDLAVLPLENSTAGTVDDVYDLLLQDDLYIWRSLKLPIQHRLLGLPGSSLSDVRTVISHPQALAQCSDLIRQQGWAVQESLNTAFAAEAVARRGDPSFAAIASDTAAAAHRLKVLRADICNSNVNQTRFIAVGRSLRLLPDADRISLILRLPHLSGALASTLAVFGDRGLNLSKIQSRPDLDNPWSYLFYLDFECQVAQMETALATLYHLNQEMLWMRLLGWYHEE